MSQKVDISEYPKEHKGRRFYVFVRSLGKVVAACYTYNGGNGHELLPEYGGPPIIDNRSGSVQVMRDIGEYTSVVDGTHISTRSQHRDHLRRHDLIEVGNERIGSMARPQDSGRRAGYDIKQALERARQG